MGCFIVPTVPKDDAGCPTFHMAEHGFFSSRWSQEYENKFDL